MSAALHPYADSAATSLPTLDWTNRHLSGGPAHSVQFYLDDAFLLEGLSRYAGGALGTGDSAIVIATAAHRDALRERLVDRGLDLDRAAAAGRYVALDAAATLARFMRRGRPDRPRFFEVVGGVIEKASAAALGAPPRVAAYGEMVALLWADGKTEAALELEQLWNELAETRAFSLHCAYPISRFSRAEDDALIRAVCAEHALVVPVESYVSLADDRERLREVALLQQQAHALQTEVGERRQAEQRLEDALQLRDQFLSAVTHDLKTPLAGIKVGAQLLQRRAARGLLRPEQIAGDLANLDACATRLTRMVEQLTDIARIQAGRPPELDLRPTDLVALAERIAAEHQRGAERHTIRVAASEREVVGHWDPVRLERVLDNLLSNARKYSPAGGEILITVSRPDQDTGLVAVQDHGIGIPATDLPLVFDQFHRATNVTARMVGSGIGLASANQLVALHGGSIDVESREGDGATFTVRLPIAGPPAKR